MFCRNCGREINDNAVVCPNCGVQVAKIANNSDDKKNTIAIVGFVLSFFIAIAGLICSIIGYRKAKNEGCENEGLALAGIIISSIELAIVLIIWISVASIVGCAVASL